METVNKILSAILTLVIIVVYVEYYRMLKKTSRGNYIRYCE